MMKKVCWMLFLVFISSQNGFCTSWICGRKKSLELGGGGTAAALALTLVRPRQPGDNETGAPAPCRLTLTAPGAAALFVMLIDVKESLLDMDGGGAVLSALGGAGAAVAGGAGLARKWSARAAPPAQDTAARPAPPTLTNKTEPCTLSIYTSDSPLPEWQLHLCGGGGQAAAAVAARAGAKLLPPRARVVWHPPASPHHHTEKLRLVVTPVYSGEVCNSSSQFRCGGLGMCVSASLVCDGVRNCPGGADEEAEACARRREPPLLELLRRLTAMNQELLGGEGTDAVTQPSVIMKIGEQEQKMSTLNELTEALKPYGPWGYIMIGALMCATMIMLLVVWECCCRRHKPEDGLADEVPSACADPSPAPPRPRSATPPAYEPPPSYSSLFPRAYKSSVTPAPEPHCSRETPPG